jgi:hypothetical protein
MRTHELVSLARAHARSPDIQLPAPSASPALPTTHLSPHDNTSVVASTSLSGLRYSLGLYEEEQPPFDPNASRPSTPVSIEDTDTNLNHFPPAVSTTQAQARAARFLTIRITRHEQQVLTGPIVRHTPKLLDIRSNAWSYYQLQRRRRTHGSAPDARPLRIGLRAGTLSTDQKAIMQLMEHHVLKDAITLNPWPEDREKLLQDAQDYAFKFLEISDPAVVTDKFRDTVSQNFYILSHLHSHIYYRSSINFLGFEGTR